MRKTIWGNTVVKNEDQYIWFAIKSVIDYLDKILIYDTGSTDKTVEIIKSLQKEYPNKIIFEEKGSVDSNGLTKLRKEMLEKTKSDWLLLVDGDEIWWTDSINEVVNKINASASNIYALVNPVINLVGDIYHHQESAAGEYNILGKKGHFNIRAINCQIPGLSIKNSYPLEGYYDKENRLIQSVNEKLFLLKEPVLHASFLKRSSKHDNNTLHRNKLKTEIGEEFPKNFKYPEVFYLDLPEDITSPFKKMTLGYRIKAGIITPFKKIRRRLK